MTHQQIEKLADKVFKQLGSIIPVDAVRAARLYDLEVYPLELEKMVKSVPSGVLTEYNGKWSIFLNVHDAITRQRFTIAHELGHFLLHKEQQFVDEFSAGETFYRDGEDNVIEREANFFAACLLMPEEKVEEIWPDCKDPKDAAARFKVSEVSMTYRLKNLGLITLDGEE